MATEPKGNFVADRLSLPLFLATRNRLRADNAQKVPAYIAQKRQLYAGRCLEEYKTDTATKRHFRHLAGFYPRTDTECFKPHLTNSTRDVDVSQPWRLPPNIYDVLMVPFSSRKGLSGAYWRKLPKTRYKDDQKRRHDKRGVWKFYEVQLGVSERWGGSCAKHKGIFVSNARDRRATSRCMISSPLTCYHDPNEPGPAHYTPRVHELSHNLVPVKKSKPHNPHLFLRNSCVPDGLRSLSRRHISFEAAPGRYDVRYPRVCLCPRNKIYMPGLQLIIDREKRRKFRRQPYTKFKQRNFCTPDWRHVPGHGFRYLFRLPKVKGSSKRSIKSPRAAKESKKSDKQDKQIQMYPDAKYLALVNAPQRIPISMRSQPVPQLPTPVRFNCISKRIVRRQLRNNKKIVFNSGQDRFPELEWRPVIMTVSMLEKLIKTLPPERRFEDHPVMRKSPSQIIGKLYATPDHMKPAYELSLRKRLFKFLPLPPPKVLVTEKDTYPDLPENERYVPQCFFNKKLDPSKYFKGDAIQKPPTEN